MILLYTEHQSNNILSPFAGFVRQSDQPNLPLERYSFERLRQKVFLGSEIKLEKVISKETGYTSYLFFFETEGKKVSGQANIPNRPGKHPVVVMIRGYADNEIYYTGIGTKKAAGVFADNGFITLAPDFLGFGSSDQASADILANRFERPETVLNLLASIKSLPTADREKVFLWGHSNGGQIAISVLEISQANIPTVLWAPVTKGFPDGVLAYVGELDDNGKIVKKAIDDFMGKYDAKQYSIETYFKDINAPIQLHQGEADPLIKVEWSDGFVDKLRGMGKNIIYSKYPKNDHNLSRDWNLVINRDLKFFDTFLEK